MEAKKVVNSPALPILIGLIFLFLPSIKALIAVVALSLNGPKLDAVSHSAPRELQRFFYKFGVLVELNSIKGVGANKYLEVEVPLAVNVPFTGHWRTNTTMRVRVDN
ncbi:MAG: hypothetical protein WCI18_03460 [Pseudomonadota bacterium]